MLSPATTWRIGATYGFLAVGLGAFGAHGLQARNLPAKSIKNWETASQYLIVHGVVLLGVSLHPRLSRAKLTAPLIATGTAMFSGSIYCLVLSSNDRLRKFMGPVTPIGGKNFVLRARATPKHFSDAFPGLLMLAGWLTMIVA